MAGQLAQRYGAIATFMAKPFSTRTGSGAHMHYHLADAGGGGNLFLDLADPRGLGLSTIAYHFIGGILEHAPRSVRSRRRRSIATSGCKWGRHSPARARDTPGRRHSSPTATTTGRRCSGFRKEGMSRIGRSRARSIPTWGSRPTWLPDWMGSSAGSSRASPTWAISTLPTSRRWSRRGVRALPQSLAEALGHFERDQVVRESLGPIADEFLRLKRDEWREYHAQVESWEIMRYLSAF